MLLIDGGLLEHRSVPSAGRKRQSFPYEFGLVIVVFRGVQLGYYIFNLLSDYLIARFYIYMGSVEVLLAQWVLGL